MSCLSPLNIDYLQSMFMSLVKYDATICLPRLDMNPVCSNSRILASIIGLPVWPTRQASNFVRSVFHPSERCEACLPFGPQTLNTFL